MLCSEVAPRPFIIAAILFGALAFLIPLILGCILFVRRRARRRLDKLPLVQGSTDTLLTVHSRVSSELPPKFERPFDIENPAPVYLSKGKETVAFSRLKTLQLLSRSTSYPSTTSALASSKKEGKECANPRIYVTQPPIQSYPYSSLYYKASTPLEEPPKKHLKATSTTTLPDGFESFLYSLRSPQSVENSVLKRLSLTSGMPTTRFARDSQGWAYHRVSLNSIAPSTVFDESSPTTRKAHSPTHEKRMSLKSTHPEKRQSKAYNRGSPSSPPLMKEVEEEIAYQPTPLAPPPAQLRSRSTTPSAGMVQYGVINQGGRESRLRRPPGLEQSDIAIKGGTLSILHSAVAKGKIKKEEAENVIGMRISMSP